MPVRHPAPGRNANGSERVHFGFPGSMRSNFETRSFSRTLSR